VPIQSFAVYHIDGGDSPTTDVPVAKFAGSHVMVGAWHPDAEAEEDDED
jgi:hypothetical protein